MRRPAGPWLQRLFVEFFPCERQRSQFAASQTLNSFARNFLEQWVNFQSDEFFCTHVLNALGRALALMQCALQKRGATEAEQMRIQPTSSAPAEIGAVGDGAAAVDDHEYGADQQRAIC